MWKFGLLTAWLVCGGFGCAASMGGKFVHRGEYDHNLFPIRVGYGPSAQGILGPDWIVDNFMATKDGPGEAKSGPEYVYLAHYDLNDDGQADTKREEPLHDLLFLHRRSGASMWIALMTMSTRDQDLDLAELSEQVIDKVAGSASTMHLQTSAADSRQFVQVVEHRTAVAQLASAACHIGTAEAYQVDIELADVDRLRLDPTSRTAKIRLVIARTPFRDTVAQSEGYAEGPPTLPVILIAALRARPQRFDSHLADFDKLMQQIGMGSKDDKTPPAQASVFRCSAPTMREAQTVPSVRAPEPIAPPEPAAAEPKDKPADKE